VQIILNYIMADASLYNATETPVLISNIEVLELLQKQQKQRVEQEKAAAQRGGGEQQQQGDNNGDAGRPLAKKQRRVRHRDWIEEQVMLYIQSTPCMQIANSTRPERHQLEKKLTNLPKKKGIGSSSESFNSTTTMTTTTTDASSTGSNGAGQQLHLQQQGGYGLMPAEALQILNFMPTQMVEIHLMIEELNERMTEKQQEEFLKFMSNTISSFQNKNDKQPSTTSTTTATPAATAPTPPTTASSAAAANDMAMETETSAAMAEATVSPVVMVKQEPT
jgi:RNA polymerase Rpb4